MSRPPAIVILGPGGLAAAGRVKDALAGALIHAPGRRVADADVAFDDAAAHLRRLFADGVPIVGVCASGILIRALAPVLGDKRDEPPVVALAEDGSAVVPLLGGHRGANETARALAAAFGIVPAVTTAGDVRFGIALDAPPAGWRLANPHDAGAFMAELLAGQTVRLEGEAGWIEHSALPFADDGGLTIFAGAARRTGSTRALVYHPAVLALGVGCERGTDPDEAVTLARATLEREGLAEGAVAGVFSIDLKADEPAVHAVAEALGAPARFFDAAALEAETPRLANPSDTVFRAVGCHGVAEGAALAAAGPDAALVVAKSKSARATCAVAQAPAPIAVQAAGRARGRLAVVGTGPGMDGWLTPEAAAMVARAGDVVGYGLYLDLLGTRLADKVRHEYALGEEEQRVRAALNLAADGREVALVSSGDPGIYAMASLVFDLIERGDDAAWRRIEIEIAPGISALQAAAARAGAPIGHDFCAISLSDLLTPWPVIERRIRAAASADFVIALYNPASARRGWQLAKAREILLGERTEATPVVIARNLGRVEESVRVVTLRDFATGDVDMLTLVLIGSTATRVVPRSDGRVWVYTPRGYSAKQQVEGSG